MANVSTKSKISKSLIKKQVKIQDAVDVLNIPKKNNNNRISILCPCHDDKHFGSCYVYPKRGVYHCYACSAHGDVIDLVSNCLNLSFQDTLSWFSEHFNGNFENTPENIKNIKKASKKKAILKECILSENELSSLGFNCTPIYFIKEYCGDSTIGYNLGPNEKFFLKDDKWFILKIIVENPWKDLIYKDFAQYKSLINNAIIAKVKETLYVWQLFKKKKFLKNNKLSKCLIMLYEEVRKEKGHKKAISEVKDSIRNAIIVYLSLWVIDNDNPHFHKSDIPRPNIEDSVELYDLFVSYGLI